MSGQRPKIGDRFITYSFVRKRPKERLIIEVCQYIPQARCWKVRARGDSKWHTPQVFFIKRQKVCPIPHKIITWEIAIIA